MLAESKKCLIQKVVALSLTAKFMSIDSKNSLFKEINSEQISNLIERSQFNKRRRKLFLFLEEVKNKISLWVFRI